LGNISENRNQHHGHELGAAQGGQAGAGHVRRDSGSGASGPFSDSNEVRESRSVEGLTAAAARGEGS
jgi:hypothetical protein